MRLKRGGSLLFLLFLVVLAVPPLSPLAVSEDDGGEQYSVWPMYGGGPSRRFYAAVDTSMNPGYVRWYYDTGSRVTSSPVIGPQGYLYFATNNGVIYCMYPTGKLRWKYYTGETITTPVTVDSSGNVYATTRNGSVISLTQEGLPRWIFPVSDGVTTGVVLSEDNILYFGTSTGELYSITTAGTFIWNVTLNAPITREITVLSSGKIIVTTGHTSIYALNMLGEVEWVHNYTSTFRYTSAVETPSGSILYLHSFSLHFFDVYGEDTLTMNIPGLEPVPPAVSDDGSIYVASSKTYLKKVSPMGDVIWSARVFGSVRSLAVSEDGTIYVGTYEGTYIYERCSIFAYYPNGTLKWEMVYGDFYPEGGPIAITIGPDGTLYSAASRYVFALSSAPPFPPVEVNVETGPGYVNLSWRRPWFDGGERITGYRVYRYADDPDNSTLLASLAPDRTFYNDTKIILGRTYYYYVTALNKIGESPPSEVVNATPIDFPTPPLNLTASPGKKWIVLSWEPPLSDGGCEILYYRIYRKPGMGSFTLLAEIKGDQFHFNDTSLKKSETYYYFVEAKNVLGVSPPSNIVVATVDIPSPPENLTVRVVQGGIELTWEPPYSQGDTPVIQYHIFRGPARGLETYYATLPSSTTTFRDTHIVSGVRYYYYVLAENSHGTSLPSNVVSAVGTSSITRPTPPGNLTAEVVEERFVLLTWLPPEDSGGGSILNYILYRGEMENRLVIYRMIPGNRTAFKDVNVKVGGTYYYYLVAVNEVGRSPRSDVVSVKIEPGTEGTSRGEKEVSVPITAFAGGATIIAVSLIIAFLILKGILFRGKDVVSFEEDVSDLSSLEGGRSESGSGVSEEEGEGKHLEEE